MVGSAISHDLKNNKGAQQLIRR
ncbi:hypothetical protein CCACVL1_00044 [Corchorus capsularis]|uniref:Uncharacterized protein n=1 Tax=Corchorus capsularis TaxID=210143 RepID=A0A1R3KZ01_COCAP|nr:hypothetical protein CCACVL1_00044 [Corchorus capsularis]